MLSGIGQLHWLSCTMEAVQRHGHQHMTRSAAASTALLCCLSLGIAVLFTILCHCWTYLEVNEGLAGVWNIIGAQECGQAPSQQVAGKAEVATCQGVQHTAIDLAFQEGIAEVSLQQQVSIPCGRYQVGTVCGRGRRQILLSQQGGSPRVSQTNS